MLDTVPTKIRPDLMAKEFKIYESAVPISDEEIEHAILLIRGQKVMLDRDLARLYDVETKALNRAVQRNRDRFPADFMFQLNVEDSESLRFQFGTLKRGQHSKYLPFVFTQEGVAMLSGVLRSSRAVQVNVAIMCAFVRLRETLSLHKELAHKLADLERKIENHDENIRSLFDAIRQLMTPPETPRREIGFHIKEDSVPYRVKTRKSVKAPLEAA
jgi:phage regulator Rha-like protein